MQITQLKYFDTDQQSRVLILDNIPKNTNNKVLDKSIQEALINVISTYNMPPILLPDINVEDLVKKYLNGDSITEGEKKIIKTIAPYTKTYNTKIFHSNSLAAMIEQALLKDGIENVTLKAYPFPFKASRTGQYTTGINHTTIKAIKKEIKK